MVFEAQKPVMSGTCAWKLSEWKYPKLAIVQWGRKVVPQDSKSDLPLVKCSGIFRDKKQIIHS